MAALLWSAKPDSKTVALTHGVAPSEATEAPGWGQWETKKATEVAFAVFHRKTDQLRVWSTSLFLAIQGIMARSLPPTTSMLWSAVLRRRAVMLG